MPEDILLIRHAETTGQAPDAPLTRAGMVQAEALVPRLAALSPDAIISSPYLRARQTIAPFGAVAGLQTKVDEDLRERTLLPFGTEISREALTAALRRSFEDRDFALEGGESQNATGVRGLTALSRVAAAGHRRPAVVGHGSLIAAILGSVDPTFGYAAWHAMQTPHLFRLAMDGPRLIGYDSLE